MIDPYLKGAMTALDKFELEVTKEERDNFKKAFLECLQTRLSDKGFAEDIQRKLTLGLTENDECPNCHCGTLEYNDAELVCRGECGNVIK